MIQYAFDHFKICNVLYKNKLLYCVVLISLRDKTKTKMFYLTNQACSKGASMRNVYLSLKAGKFTLKRITNVPCPVSPSGKVEPLKNLVNAVSVTKLGNFSKAVVVNFKFNIVVYLLPWLPVQRFAAF